MEIVEPLLNWYKENARDLPWRRTDDPYAIWVSEIMLQQTRVAAVLPYYARWMQALPDVYALADVPDERLHKLWEGLGYYSRAHNLKRAAQVIVSEHGGRVPDNFSALCALPGIGAYTAGAVASIAFCVPVPAVDGNVLRVWARLHADARDIADPSTKRAVTDAVAHILPKDRPGTFNAALMELGATVCLPGGAPRCEACPLADVCRAHRDGTETALPVRTKKKPRRIEYKTVFVLTNGQGQPMALRRADTGLLAGLWQLPETAGTLDADAAAAQLDAWGVSPAGEIGVYARRHIFTHVEWRMRVYAVRIRFAALPDGWRPLEADMALPAAFRVCMQGEGKRHDGGIDGVGG